MRSQNRGGPPALPPEEAAVTYSRIEDAEELPQFGGDPLEDEGRREPTFTAMRVDPPQNRRESRRAQRTARVDLDEFDDRPISLDPEAMGAIGARPPRRRRSRALSLVLLIGALAVLGGIGVLGATVLKVLYGAPPVTASAPATENPANAAADATVVPVSTPTAVLPDSGSAGPGVLALPANDGPIDVTPAAPAPQPQAALEPQITPSPAPVARAPAPEIKPAAKATASTELPPLPTPAPAEAAVNPAAPSTDADINNALSDVDRLLAEKKAQAGAQPQNISGAQPQNLSAAQPQNGVQQNGVPPTALAPFPAPPADQSAALNLTPQPLTEPPPLPAPTTVADPSIPVPPADIPNPSN